jgi:hypothetical protein
LNPSGFGKSLVWPSGFWKHVHDSTGRLLKKSADLVSVFIGAVTQLLYVSGTRKKLGKK